MKKYNEISTDDIIEEIVKPNNVQSLNNEFYFYNEINIESVFTLNKFLSDTQKQCMFQKIQFDLPKPPPMKIYINSDGGEIFSAFTSIDRIKSSKVPVYTYVEGIVASAASLISICGHKRFISKNAVMLVHQLRSWCGGTHENIKDEAKNLELLSNKIKKIYLENTKFKEKDLEEMLKHDIYLSAEDCLKYGLVDVIL
jgi:ATP-dependent protease ClpP protease subunit